MGRNRGRRLVVRLVPVATVVAMLSTVGVGAARASLASPLPVLTSLLMSPSTASIVQGQSQQFTAVGVLSDGTLQPLTNGLTWTTSPPSVGSVSPIGLVNGLSAGVESVTATAPAGLLGLLSPLTGTATLAVLPVLTAIALAPTNPSIGPGQLQQFTATGLFSNGSTENITDAVSWTSLSSALASVSGTGLATGLAPGVDAIVATAPAGLSAGPLAGLVSPVAGSVPLTVSGSPPPTPSSPSFGLSPASGKKRSVVTSTGADFPPGAPVVVRYLTGTRARSTSLCQAVVSSDGTFSCSGAIPGGRRSGRLGTHTVTAAVANSGASSAVFDLLRGVAGRRTPAAP